MSSKPEVWLITGDIDEHYEKAKELGLRIFDKYNLYNFKKSIQPLKGKNVVVIDNNPRDLETTTGCLLDVEAIVSKFNNPKEALAVIIESCPVLIISDIEMPGMNGFEVNEEISKMSFNYRNLFQIILKILKREYNNI